MIIHKRYSNVGDIENAHGSTPPGKSHVGSSMVGGLPGKMSQLLIPSRDMKKHGSSGGKQVNPGGETPMIGHSKGATLLGKIGVTCSMVVRMGSSSSSYLLHVGYMLGVRQSSQNSTRLLWMLPGCSMALSLASPPTPPPLTPLLLPLP